MARAIGMVECTTVSTGFKAADEMAKAADVEILQAEVTCPGKFVILVAGELSAVHLWMWQQVNILIKLWIPLY